MNRKGVIVFALGLGLCAPILVSAEEPSREEARVAPLLPWQESTPTARMFLQLPFETPAVVGKRDFAAEIRLFYSNSILVGSASALAVDVDMESAELLALFRYGFAAGFEAQIAVPVIVDYGGFLDGAIEGVERLFGAASMRQRRDRPHNLARFHIVRPDGIGISMNGAGVGLGDVWTGIKVLVAEHVGMVPAVAFRAAIKVPTGRPPYGSGAVDVGGSLLLGWMWRWVNLWIELDAVVPTADLKMARVSTHAYGASQLGLVVPFSDLLALNLQWSSHFSPFSRTAIPQLDAPTHYLLLGVTIGLSRSVRMEVAAVENIFCPASGLDVAILFGLRIQPEEP